MGCCSQAVANDLSQKRSMIRLASSLPNLWAAAFKLAMCWDSAAALPGAGLAGVDFPRAGAVFFFAGVEVAGVGVEAEVAEPGVCLSLVLMEVTSLPVIFTPCSSPICLAMAAGPFSGYLAR